MEGGKVKNLTLEILNVQLAELKAKNENTKKEISRLQNLTKKKSNEKLGDGKFATKQNVKRGRMKNGKVKGEIEVSEKTKRSRIHEEKRRHLPGKKGGACLNVGCPEKNAQWLNIQTKEYFCEACAKVINELSIKKSGQKICYNIVCENRSCPFWHSEYELNCYGWGLTDIAPIDCILKRREDAKEKKVNKRKADNLRFQINKAEREFEKERLLGKEVFEETLIDNSEIEDILIERALMGKSIKSQKRIKKNEQKENEQKKEFDCGCDWESGKIEEREECGKIEESGSIEKELKEEKKDKTEGECVQCQL